MTDQKRYLLYDSTTKRYVVCVDGGNFTSPDRSQATTFTAMQAMVVKRTMERLHPASKWQVWEERPYDVLIDPGNAYHPDYPAPPEPILEEPDDGDPPF